MEPRLQRRVQRYGWDLAADRYEPLWRSQLAAAQLTLLELAAPAPGERALDVACGTGLVTFAVAKAVGATGRVLGVDIAERMVEGAERRLEGLGLANVRFSRMDAEQLRLDDASFDLALCSLGLMYLPNPEAALAEMRRVLRGRGRIGLAVWGERSRCGWAESFPIVDAEVASDVCPLFFRLGVGDTLARLAAEAGFTALEQRRITTTLAYKDDREACDAVFVGGPMAMAWSRLDPAARARARARYLDAIAEWRCGQGYEIPGEFVLVAAEAPVSP